MAVSIKSPRVDAQRQRRLIRRRRLAAELPVLQEKAIETAQPFDPDSLYDEQGLPS